MNRLNRILAEREGWTGVTYDGVFAMGEVPLIKTKAKRLPSYNNDNDLDRVIRGLDDNTQYRYSGSLVEVIHTEDEIREAHDYDMYEIMKIDCLLTATPQQKRAALARVFGVEED